MNTKMLEKTVHLFNVDLAEDISMQEYPKISEAAVCTCATTQLFLKIQQNSQECTCARVSLQPATFKFMGKEMPAYIAFCEFCEIFQEHLLWKTSCELALKQKFYEKWGTDILIIIKRYREVDNSFKKLTLQKRVYTWEPLIKSWLEVNSNFQLFHRYFFSKICY